LDVVEKRMIEAQAEELTPGLGDVLPEDAGYLPLRLRRRYAKAKCVFEAGVWSARSVDLLLSIMIGSAAGVRNSYAELREDNRELRRQLAKLGLEYADCFCGELSPESHQFTKRDGTLGITVGSLWHLHGFARFSEPIKAVDLHSVLSPLWGKIHGSEVVNVKVETDFEKAIKYSVKDAVKGYCSDGSSGRRLLMSRNWLPAGYRAVDKVLTQWALAHGANWRFDDDLDSFQGEYIPYAWGQKRDYVRRWCEGETLLLDFGDYRVYIDGARILRSVGKLEGWSQECY
jgi:hypothetical protein